MKTTLATKLFLLMFILMSAMTMLGCDSSDNPLNTNDTKGLIYDQTAYRITVNFLGVKIVEAMPGDLLPEKDLKNDTTYLFQITVFDNSGKVLQVIDSSMYIDPDSDDHQINGQTCNWFIHITGNQAPFNVTSAS